MVISRSYVRLPEGNPRWTSPWLPPIQAVPETGLDAQKSVVTRLVLARMADLPKILFQHIQSFQTIKKPIYNYRHFFPIAIEHGHLAAKIAVFARVFSWSAEWLIQPCQEGSILARSSEGISKVTISWQSWLSQNATSMWTSWCLQLHFCWAKRCPKLFHTKGDKHVECTV